MTTTYLASGIDAKGNWLDTDPLNRGEGFPTVIPATGPMLEFVNTTKTGILHDFDNETHATKRIAYWLIAVDGIVRDIYITAWGRKCGTKVPAQGPGCNQPTPVPAAS